MDRPAPLIGLTGWATAGKDVFADALVRDLSYVKIGFADPMYAMAEVLNPIFEFNDRQYESLREILAECDGDWTVAKRWPCVREYLQCLGTEAGRQCLWPDVWVDAAMRKVDGIPHVPVVISNVRFENEAEAILKRGGDIIQIDRPGVGPVNDHVSDRGEAFKFATYRVVNDGTAQEFSAKAKDVIARLLGHGH